MFITDKIVLKKYFFLSSQQDPDFDSWYQYSGFVSMLFYFFLSLRYYMMYRKMIVQVVSYADVVLFRWIKNFLMAFLSMLVLRLLFLIALQIPAFAKLAYTGPWWEYFSFAIIFYYIAITGYSNAVEAKVAFKIHLLEYKKVMLLPHPIAVYKQTDFIEDTQLVEIDIEETGTVQKSNENNALANDWKPKIISLLQTAKIYEDPELSLTQMARQLQTNASILSKAINQGFGLNFNDFINHYRIEAVKQKLQAGEQKSQTLLGIAYDCGFNSKATFNRAFKKATGQSPKEWLDKETKF
jgi:AraC-like DNA-binding protein